MSVITDELVVPPLAATNQLVDIKTGIATAATQVWLIRLARAVNTALDILGQFNGVIGPAATVVGHPGTVQSTVQRLTGIGQLASFLDVAADRNLDNVSDTATFQRTTLNQVAGAATAFNALVASAPVTNNALLWSGSAWVPSDVPIGSIPGLVPALNAPLVINKWLQTYNASTGAFGYAQVNFNNLSGTATAAQLPALSALTGAITTGQLPTGLFSGTVALAKITGGGTDGSLTLVNGSVSAYTPPT